MSSKRKVQMKSLRTWNRRDFNVGTAGWFTVLKPAGWFAASRLPGGFRYLGGQRIEALAPQAHENPVPEPTIRGRVGDQETTILLQTIEVSTHDRRLIRQAFVVLTAAAVTSILLWWIAFPRFH
jgi:hypothetical protein